jgi:hypothetical protein
VVERLNLASRWRWTVLLVGLLCLFVVAHPMTAHAARVTPTVTHSVTARTSTAIFYPLCPECGQPTVAVRAMSTHPGGRPSARGRTRLEVLKRISSREGG